MIPMSVSAYILKMRHFGLPQKAMAELFGVKTQAITKAFREYL